MTVLQDKLLHMIKECKSRSIAPLTYAYFRCVDRNKDTDKASLLKMCENLYPPTLYPHEQIILYLNYCQAIPPYLRDHIENNLLTFNNRHDLNEITKSMRYQVTLNKSNTDFIKKLIPYVESKFPQAYIQIDQ